MDLLELALNPRKAKLRMSPFTNDLPEGMVRKLEYFFGDYASADPSERANYSRDAMAAPAAFKLLMKRNAWAVVRPRIKGDLFELIRFANDNLVPIIPRGGGTSGYGGSVPTEGGIVVDMRSFTNVLRVDKKAKTVTVEANIRFWHLEQELRKQGLALRQYPTSAMWGTVAGWVAQGGGGVGSLKYGPFSNDVLEVGLIRPDGKEVKLSGKDLELVSETHGIAGFMTEVTLKVRDAKEETVHVAEFDAIEKATLAAQRIVREVGAWSLSFNTPEYVELVNAAAGEKLFPLNRYSIMVTLESGDDAAALEKLKGIVTASGGSFVKDEAARKAWKARFDHLNVKRLGPSVVVSEVVLPIEKLREGVEMASAAGHAERQCVWAIMINPNEFDLIYYALDDERRPTYPTALGNSLAIIEGAKKLGGRGYSTGVLGATDSKALLGKERLKRLREYRKEHDKREVFNPGPVLGARSRLNPLPLKDLNFQLRLSGPILRSQRGMFMYRGGDKADPGFRALNRAIGKELVGPLAEHEYDVTTCIFCGMCNAVAPERDATILDTQLPRGRVQAAKAVLDGDAPPTRHLQRNASRTSLQHAPDAICPTKIPIARVTDLLLAACAEHFGPLPEHAPLVANLEKSGNVLGRPAENRTKWATFPWDFDARTVFFGDDVGSFEAPEALTSAARVLHNADLRLNYLGKAEKHSGATLFETGNRAPAEPIVTEMLEALAKKRIDLVVSPDANAVRAVRLDWPLVAKKAGIEAVPAAQHTTVAIAALLKAKKLELGEPWAKKVYYHAPEGLDAAERQAGLDLLKALGAEAVPMEHLECGHGRALNLFEPNLAQLIGETCLKGAKAAGVQVIVTASPGCYQTLRTIARKAKADVEVVDLHEVIATRMKVREGGAAVVVTAPAEAEPEVAAEPEIPPDHFRVEFVKEKKVLAVHKNQNVLDAALEAGVEAPYSCRAGSCDTCSARWEGVAMDQSAGAALSADQQKTFVLTCIARPRGPVKLWLDERPK